MLKIGALNVLAAARIEREIEMECFGIGDKENKRQQGF